MYYNVWHIDIHQQNYHDLAYKRQRAQENESTRQGEENRNTDEKEKNQQQIHKTQNVTD